MSRRKIRLEVFLDVVASAGLCQDFEHLRRELFPVRRLRQANVIGAAHFEQVHIAVSLANDFERGGGVEDGLANLIARRGFLYERGKPCNIIFCSA